MARHLLAPGDTVFVEDPAWFLMFGRFAAFGANVVGVPRNAGRAGPRRAEESARPAPAENVVVGSVLHNPTSTSISAANAHGLLRLADEHGFVIVEDDVYGDLNPGNALRLASLDQLKHVIYLGGFSKTLAASLRVGFIAASHERAQQLTDLKMLTGLTTPELTERVMARLLAEGQYRRSLDRLRGKVDAARDKTARALEKMGAVLFAQPNAGIFLWADFGRDTNVIAAAAAQSGNSLRAGQPVFADAVAEPLDARLRRRVGESRGDEVSRAGHGLTRLSRLVGCRAAVTRIDRSWLPLFATRDACSTTPPRVRRRRRGIARCSSGPRASRSRRQLDVDRIAQNPHETL